MADTDALRTPKEPSSGGGFLSKITRSPSRKQHKPQPSIPPPSVDAPFLGQNISTSALQTGSKRVQPRPGFQRAPTAPAGSASLKAIRLDLTATSPVESLRSGIEPGNFTGTFPMTLSKSAGATPSSADQQPPPMNGTGPPGAAVQGGTTGNQNPNSLYQHIHELSNKRIATLDYMRKAHEGRIHWFNTIHFSKADVSRLPSYSPNKLSRRATNYFLLGLSIPSVLDVHPQPHPQTAPGANAAVALDFLRSLNNLLTEFESFQQLHPSDGSTASSLSRARIPQMFKRATQTSGKPRRTSNAAGTEIGLPMQQAVSPPADGSNHHTPANSIETTNNINNFSSSTSTLVTPSPATSMPSVNFPSSSTFPISSPDGHANSSLLPNEGPYAYLLTPPLPFAPDFYCVFATLCDVIIDAYSRLLQLISSPAVCTANVGELFNKTDARLRKVIVGGIVRDFEGAAREGARKELMGVQRVVFGGLMGG